MTPTPDLTRRPRTRRVFSYDDMTRMAALYYDPGVPMHRVGAAFGVPASTLLRWIAEMDWPRRSARRRAGDGAPPAVPVPHAGTQAQDAQGVHVRAPAMVEAIAPRRAPSLLTSLRRASQVARRELDAAARMKPASMADRERIAAQVDRLSRTLDRITRSLREEENHAEWRRSMRERG